MNIYNSGYTYNSKLYNIELYAYTCRYIEITSIKQVIYRWLIAQLKNLVLENELQIKSLFYTRIVADWREFFI